MENGRTSTPTAASPVRTPPGGWSPLRRTDQEDALSHAGELDDLVHHLRAERLLVRHHRVQRASALLTAHRLTEVEPRRGRRLVSGGERFAGCDTTARPKGVAVGVPVHVPLTVAMPGTEPLGAVTVGIP